MAMLESLAVRSLICSHWSQTAALIRCMCPWQSCARNFSHFLYEPSVHWSLMLWIFLSPLICLTYFVWAALLGMLNIQKQASE